MEEYIIPYKGLPLGSHSFEWSVGKDFFASYEMSEIDDATIKVQVTLVKHTQFLEVVLQIDGRAEVQCDRCLDPLSVDIDTEVPMYVKFGETSGEDEDDENDVIILSHSDTELDMKHYIYEYVHLALPIKRVHEKGKCNKEMIARLEQYIVNT
ncbi:MAG: DUF177 domain-containing protein [Bacteroidales bacterium]|nr:DUF177 domain-containing protein [Bacteroidales bacterium]